MFVTTTQIASCFADQTDALISLIRTSGSAIIYSAAYRESPKRNFQSSCVEILKM